LPFDGNRDRLRKQGDGLLQFSGLRLSVNFIPGGGLHHHHTPTPARERVEEGRDVKVVAQREMARAVQEIRRRLDVTAQA